MDQSCDSEFDVSILIVCYTSRTLIRDCLESVDRDGAGVGMEVLLTDNSDDGTVDLVRAEFPWVRIIESRGNVGFAGGNNLLARHARGRYLLLLNPDTIVREGAIRGLLSFAEERSQAGAWGGITVLPDGRTDPGCVQAETGIGAAVRYLLGMTRKIDYEAVMSQPARVPTLSGAFMMVPVRVWRELGGFDESFFMYSEEAELCLRIRRSGREIWRTPAAQVTHLVGGGASNRGPRITAMMRGRMQYMRKHFGPGRAWLMGAITWCHGASRYLGSWIALPVIGKARSAELRRAFGPIVFEPSNWWGGWNQVNRDCGATVQGDRAGFGIGSDHAAGDPVRLDR